MIGSVSRLSSVLLNSCPELADFIRSRAAWLINYSWGEEELDSDWVRVCQGALQQQLAGGVSSAEHDVNKQANNAWAACFAKDGCVMVELGGNAWDEESYLLIARAQLRRGSLGPRPLPFFWKFPFENTLPKYYNKTCIHLQIDLSFMKNLSIHT